jgi:hypothetical protein
MPLYFIDYRSKPIFTGCARGVQSTLLLPHLILTRCKLRLLESLVLSYALGE